MMTKQLSKSKILRGIQCPKSLWLYENQKELITISDQQQAIFDTGSEVGKLAQQLFPGGVDVTIDRGMPNIYSAAHTIVLMDQGVNAIYEATFIYDDTLVAVDILVKTEEGWSIYEVKSTTSVKEPLHIQDAAIQKYIVEGRGETVDKTYIVTLNKEYNRQGGLDVQQLFTCHDISAEVDEILPQIPQIITDLKNIQGLESVPNVSIGPRCEKPYTCDFKGHCWNFVPDYSVLDLAYGKGKQWELYNMGIMLLEDIPEDFNLNDNQRMQVEAQQQNRQFINREAISRFLKAIEYPIYHFDFETISSAIPLFDNSRPYQQIPFQYSLHLEQDENSEPIHYEYLADHEGGDPRELLIHSMLDKLGTYGTILAYHKSFEVSVLRELANDFPQYADRLLTLIDRIVDLEDPFRKYYYHTKEMKGRSSIKYVLPALVPEMSYETLQIKEGGTAGKVFLQMMKGEYEGDIVKARQALLDYCEMDTLAMVKLLEKLESVK